MSDEEVCRARDEFDTRVWRYNLYHRDNASFRGQPVVEGERVALNSGFPFSYDSTSDGVRDAHGWFGYHGLWTESESSPVDDQSIYRYDYDNDSEVEYRLRYSPGQLIRRTASQDLLSSFIDDEFHYWGVHPDLGVEAKWLVTVDQNLGFRITATFEWGDNGPVFSDVVDHDDDPQTDPLPVAATIVVADNQSLWLWSEALGGNVVYQHDPSVATQDRAVTFYAQTFIGPQDASLFPAANSQVTLYCYERCLKGGLTQTDVDSAAGDSDLYHAYQGQPLTYTLSSSDGRVTLTDDSNGATVSAVGLSMDQLGFDWGINSGEMLTDPLADPSEPWRVYDQPLSYRWESGPNEWNVLVTAIDALDQPVVLDRPLELPYVHQTSNDVNADARYDGKRFLLHYAHEGGLGGFPYVQDGNSDRWYPQFGLVDAVTISDSTNSFVVKGLEKEQSMRVVPSAECIGLDTTGLSTDPDLALPDQSDIGQVSISVSDLPQVDDPPAVIEGDVQT